LVGGGPFDPSPVTKLPRENRKSITTCVAPHCEPDAVYLLPDGGDHEPDDPRTQLLGGGPPGGGRPEGCACKYLPTSKLM